MLRRARAKQVASQGMRQGKAVTMRLESAAQEDVKWKRQTVPAGSRNDSGVGREWTQTQSGQWSSRRGDAGGTMRI